MTWLGLVAALIKSVAALASFLKDRQLIEAGQAQAIAAHLKGALDDIKAAQDARDHMDGYLRKHPNGLPPDDPNRRD